MLAQARKGEYELPAELEANVDQVIAECGGDSRAAVRTLLVANGLALAEIAEIEARWPSCSPMSHGAIRAAIGNGFWSGRKGRFPIRADEEGAGRLSIGSMSEKRVRANCDPTRRNLP